MTFKIKDIKDKEQFVNTHYFHWLQDKKPKDIHSIDTKIEYLSEQGFTKGTDKISEQDLYRLQSIEEYYFYAEIKPTL
tara:strand:+ start:38 stop:271 length:234 start_codon:yes stop_codon:yes gene_type:complete